MSTLYITAFICTAILMFFPLFGLTVIFKQNIIRKSQIESDETNQRIRGLLSTNTPPTEKQLIYNDWYNS